MFRIKNFKWLTVLVTISFITSTLLCPIIVHAGGLKFGITSVVKDKIDELKEKKREKEKTLEEERIVNLAENTKVLSADTIKQLVQQEGSIYYFNTQATEIEDLKPGDIILSGEGEGLLRKVAGISVVGDQYAVETTTANLEEAFEKLKISFKKELTSEDIDSQKAPWLKSGVSIRKAPRRIQKLPSGHFVELIEVVLYDQDNNLYTTNDQIVANGEIAFTISTEFEIDISWGRLQKLRFVETNQVITSLEIRSEKGLQWSRFLKP